MINFVIFNFFLDLNKIQKYIMNNRKLYCNIICMVIK